MGFRNPTSKTEKQIKVDEFGIGSCIVNGNSTSFLLTTDSNYSTLYLTNLKTFVTTVHALTIEDIYHITAREAYDISNIVNGLVNEANTRSDYGWNSKGLKDVRVEYTDN